MCERANVKSLRLRFSGFGPIDLTSKQEACVELVLVDGWPGTSNVVAVLHANETRSGLEAR